MLRQKTIICAVALLFGCLAITPTASSAVIGDCTLTGYTFMGGGMAYTSTAAGPNAKDYFLAQPLNYMMGPDNYFGYGWAKFDNLTTETVGSAYLVLDLLGVGSMGLSPATPEAPAVLDVYNPGAIDVEDLGDDAGLRATLRDNLDASSPILDDFTMTSNGAYYLDITDIYNGWVDGSITNNGLVFSANDNADGAGYASFGNAVGSAPYISTSPVPEPSTLLIFVGGAGLLAMGTRWRARA